MKLFVGFLFSLTKNKQIQHLNIIIIFSITIKWHSKHIFAKLVCVQWQVINNNDIQYNWIAFHMEKQLSLLFLLSLTVSAESGGAVLEVERTASYLRRAAGLGRFSGTMVSSELPCQGGHALFSLHLGPPPTEETNDELFDAILLLFMISLATASWPIEELANSSPINATPTRTHSFLQFPSFFALYYYNKEIN